MLNRRLNSATVLTCPTTPPSANLTSQVSRQSSLDILTTNNTGDNQPTPLNINRNNPFSDAQSVGVDLFGNSEPRGYYTSSNNS